MSGAAGQRRRLMRRAVRPVLALASLASLGAGGASGAEELECLIRPWRDITVSAAIQGVVEEVLVDRGDVVEKGQTIARLESSVEQARVEVARARAQAQGQILSGKARLEYAESSLQRLENLSRQDVASASDLDEAMSTKRVAEAALLEARETMTIAELELRQAEAMLERRTIQSPATGVVVERILSPGEYTDPPQLLRLAQIDPLRVEVFAPLELLGRIRPGMQARVLTESPIRSEHTATVTVVDQVIDAASGTFGVRLELSNPDHSLPAGLKCHVNFPAVGG